MNNKYLIKKETNRGNINLMKRRTTTRQLSESLTNHLLTVTKAEVYYKSSRKTDVITDSFLEDFQFLCESGCFMDCVGWHNEKDFKTGQYIIEAGRTDAYSENIITIHMRANDSANVEDIERALKIEEE